LLSGCFDSNNTRSLEQHTADATAAAKRDAGNPNRATLAVARKIVCYMLAVERRHQDFVPAEKFSRTPAA